MILAEKILKLRKQKNWSQEDLAERLDVSRQSVSKWESTASVPDLDKIIRMSQIFDVSTDYLLKDEIEETAGLDAEKFTETFHESPKESPKRKITLEEANAFMDMTRKVSSRISMAVAGCILSPVPLICLAGVSKCYPGSISEAAAAGFGVILLLLFVAASVAVFITTSMQMSRYKFITEEPFELEYGIAGIVEQKLNNYQKTFTTSIATGTCLCIVSVLPVLLSAVLPAPTFTTVVCIALLFPVVAIAVVIIIRAGMIQACYKQLLQTEDYSIQEKESNKTIAPFASIYWMIIVAIYLGISFYYDSFDRSWIVWPSATVLYSALCVLFKQLQKKR